MTASLYSCPLSLVPLVHPLPVFNFLFPFIFNFVVVIASSRLLLLCRWSLFRDSALRWVAHSLPTAALRAAQSKQNLVHFLLLVCPFLNMHEFEQGFQGVPADYANLELFFGCSLLGLALLGTLQG